jgi:hypothetical protein
MAGPHHPVTSFIGRGRFGRAVSNMCTQTADDNQDQPEQLLDNSAARYGPPA